MHNSDQNQTPSIDIPSFIKEHDFSKAQFTAPDYTTHPVGHNALKVRKCVLKVINMYVEDNGGSKALKHYCEVHGFPITYPSGLAMSEASVVGGSEESTRLYKERLKLMSGGINPQPHSTDALKLYKRGMRYYSNPSQYPLLRALGYLYLQGWRWVSYQTLDGVVIGFEQKQPVNNIPIPLRAEYRVMLDFEQLFGKSLCSIFTNREVKEVNNNTNSIYISI